MRRSRIEALASAGASAAFGLVKFWLDRHPIAIPDWVDPLLLPAAGALALLTLFLWLRPDSSSDQPSSTGNQTVTAGRDVSGVTGLGSGITANNLTVNLGPPTPVLGPQPEPPTAASRRLHGLSNLQLMDAAIALAAQMRTFQTNINDYSMQQFSKE